MIIIYHHDDLDGQCSAAQVRESMEDITANPIRCIAVQYNGTTWKKEEIEEGKVEPIHPSENRGGKKRSLLDTCK